jgi:hypothetical protein
MTQADSVLSTPPTNTPVDTTRRRFLAAAAVASAVGAGSLAAAARAPDVPQAATTPKHSGPDPVFGLIEAHRQAGLDHDAALVEQARLEQIGDPAADLAGEAPCHAEFSALDVLLAAPATTLPGTLAKLAYLQDIAERDAWMFDDRKGCTTRLIEGFAATIANISAVLS